MIKVNNLSKEFHEQGTSNELLAVDHVDFTILRFGRRKRIW